MASKNAPTNPTRQQMNKKARASFAKETINVLIPKILQSNQRARDGTKNSERIRYDPLFMPKTVPLQGLPPVSETSSKPLPESSSLVTEGEPPITLKNPSPSPGTRPLIKVVKSDTYDAALAIHQALSIASPSHGPKTTTIPPKSSSATPRIAVLNMASSSRPGGGVLNGALAQEESLCVRSTLLASLHDHFYGLPGNTAIYSPDVLVFRDSQNRDVPKSEWFFVDVISCAALRGPDVTVRSLGGGQTETTYADEGLREEMRMRVRTLLQVAQRRGVRRLVLGAWGCGAYRNPPGEVAGIFRGEIMGTRKGRGVTVEGSGIEEIVFAIFDEGENLRAFKEAFKDVDIGGDDDAIGKDGNRMDESIDGE